ncbi:MAG: thiamine phosphate synthase [bacterium]
MPAKPQLPHGLYGITSNDFGMSHEQSALALLKAGVKIIQYREKHAQTRRMYDEAMRIKQLCKAYNAMFIVNDRMDIAIAVDADGIHVGNDDMPVEIVKKYSGNRIIGLSVRNEDELKIAQLNEVDYIGVGAVYPTSTKQDSTYIGIDMLAKIARLSKIPIYAIGGITIDKLPELKRHNIHGIAVISAILNTHDPEQAAREFIRVWNTSN